MKTNPTFSFIARQGLENLCLNVRTARLRRGDTEEIAAQRAGVSRPTWRRLEAGHPSVSVGLAFEALQLYGFSEQIFSLDDPDQDAEGRSNEAARRPLRGRTIK